MMLKLKTAAKYAFAPLIYRHAPTGLRPERLGVYLNGLVDRVHLSGDVAEIGCNLCGTSILAYKAMRNMGWKGRYICYDTFGGFVREQFDADVKLGIRRSWKTMFSANSLELVSRILKYHQCADIDLVKGDATKLSEGQLSKSYSVILLDVDLSEPTYECLKVFWPRLLPGGAIYVDDCPEEYGWKARIGYKRFCKEMGVVETYHAGLGILYK